MLFDIDIGENSVNMNMHRFTERQADAFLFLGLLSWVLRCIHPAIGMLLQYPLIVILVVKCDIKTLPTLLILMLGRSNLTFFGSDAVFALKVGITLTPESLFGISTFLFVLVRLIQRRFDAATSWFACLWLLSFIPAALMSFRAKSYGLSGIWSGPIMDFFSPAVYFWAVSMAETYQDGKYYFASRLSWIMLMWNGLVTAYVVQGFTFFSIPLSIGLCAVAYSDPELRGLRPICTLGLFAGLANLLFSRSIRIENYAREFDKDLNEADLGLGSTFTRMAVFAASVLLMFGLRKRIFSGSLTRLIPVLMVVANIGLVSFVITTQSGNKAKDVVYDYANTEERFTWKLFGDRAAVWTEGWNEVKDSPYIVKDMRKFIYVHPSKGPQLKMLAHNQFLVLLGREGFWLGLTLAIFIIWVQVRAFRCYTQMPEDRMFSLVFLPVSGAIFWAVGTAGQSVASSRLWGNSLATMVMPGIIYGQWLLSKTRMRMGWMPCPATYPNI